MNIGQLMAFFTEKYQVTLSMISIGQVCIYNKYTGDAKDKLSLSPGEAYERLAKKPLPKFKKYIQIEANGETLDGVDALLPTIKYQV